MFTPFAELVPSINDSGTPLATDSTTVNTSFGRRVRVAADRLVRHATGLHLLTADPGYRLLRRPSGRSAAAISSRQGRSSAFAQYVPVGGARAGDQASKGADELLTAAPPQGKSRRHGLDPSRKNR